MPQHRQRILMFAGGGVAHTSGGVGTLILYLMDAWRTQKDSPVLRVIDTRGQGGRLGGIGYFLVSLGVLLHHGLCGRSDIVHLHMTTRGSVLRKLCLASLARALRLPVIMHMHGADFFSFYPRMPVFLRNWLRRSMNKCSKIIVLGKAWQDFLIQQVGVMADLICIIPNGVAPAIIRPHDKKHAEPLILFLGRVGPRKGVPELLSALASEKLRHYPWHAIIAGDGEVEATRARVASIGLETKITVPGWMDRQGCANLLGQADIFVLPSHHEAMPIAVLEALAYGTPVITTPVGAIPEFLTDNETALLVPAGDATALADAMQRLLADPDLCAKLAAAGKGAFAENFEVAAMAQRIAALYAGLKTEITAPQNNSRANAKRLRALLGRIESVSSELEKSQLLQRMAQPRAPTILSFVNQHALNLAWTDCCFADIITGSDILLRDGVGAEIAMILLGLKPGLNMVGTSFLPCVLNKFLARRVILFGTKPHWLALATHRLRAEGCKVVATLDGFQPAETYVNLARETEADLIILAMGMPKQEKVGAAIAAAVTYPVLIINGGAILDYLANRFQRAPAWILRARMEWVFRLALEPRRLWRRYITGGAVFLWRLLLLKWLAHEP